MGENETQGEKQLPSSLVPRLPCSHAHPSTTTRGATVTPNSGSAPWPPWPPSTCEVFLTCCISSDSHGGEGGTGGRRRGERPTTTHNAAVERDDRKGRNIAHKQGERAPKNGADAAKQQRAPTPRWLISLLLTRSVRPSFREAAAGGLSPSDSPGISPTGHGGKERGRGSKTSPTHTKKGETTCCPPSLPPSPAYPCFLPSLPRPKLPRNFVRCNVELETCERSHQ